MNNCIRTSGMFHIMLIRLCKVDPFRPHFYMHIVIHRFNIANSEQSSHTPGGSHHRPYLFNWKERKIDK